MKAIQIGQDIDYKVFIKLSIEAKSLIDNETYIVKQIYDINCDCFDDIDSFELARNINKYSNDIIDIIDKPTFMRTSTDKVTHVSYGIMDEEDIYWKIFDNEKELVKILNNRF